MSQESITTELFLRILRLGLVYVVLQVVVGVETGLGIVYLNLISGMPLGAAMATALPIGLPLLLGQGALYLIYKSGIVGRMWNARTTHPDPAANPPD